MVNIRNFRDLKVGDKVQVRAESGSSRILEGTVTWIHPANGWANIRLNASVTRMPSDKPGVKYTLLRKEFTAAYESSYFFEDIYRAGDDEVFQSNIKRSATGQVCAVEAPATVDETEEYEPTAEDLRESEKEAGEVTHCSEIDEFRRSVELHYRSLGEAVARIQERVLRSTVYTPVTYMCLG